MSNSYQKIAERIAEIASYHTRILRGDEYDIPADVQAAIDARAKAEHKRGYVVEEEVRKEFADKYLQLELGKLKDEAADLHVNIDPELVAALLPSIANVASWQSSSYTC